MNPIPSAIEKAREIAKTEGIYLPEQGEKDRIAESVVIRVEVIALAFDAIRREENAECAKVADDLYNGFHSPYEYSEDVAKAIRSRLKGEGI